VGRARELGELERLLDSAGSGAGATALVTGDAGIGKSRLASELISRARAADVDVLVGQSIDLVGAELPYQPFAQALRPLGALPGVDSRVTGSQLRVFQETLELLGDHAAAVPVLLVLEDLHWADTSTLDLVVFLAHNIDDRRIMVLGTYRADELSSAERMGRVAAGVERSGSAVVLELGPLERDELSVLVAAHSEALVPATLTDAIFARSEGNPFFAQELLAASDDGSGVIPGGLRDLLLRRVARLDRRTQAVLRVAAAAGRDIDYRLLQATAALPEEQVRESLRLAVERGVLVAEQATGTFRFRHALLAEAVYATILPGEREALHARLADELARSGAATAAELAPHWAAAGRSAEALVASIAAAREAAAVFGLAEAHAHLERALALWPDVPDAAELAGLDLAALCSWAAELAGETGAAPRAVELTQRAIELVGDDDPHRTALLHVRLGEDLHASGWTDAAVAAFERAAERVPPEPPSPERAYALASHAAGLMVTWRYADSVPIAEQALALARRVGAPKAEVRALTVLGGDLAYLGRGEEGLAHFREALLLAEETGDLIGLERAHVNLSDALMMLGRPGESARQAERGLEVVRKYGLDGTVLFANQIEALIAAGEWDNADGASATALRAVTANFPYMLFMLRADIELGRGDFAAARAHLDAALATLREDRGLGIYDIYLAELALWERRWTDAERSANDAVGRAGSSHAAQLRVWFCSKGLRAHAELAALARARRDKDAAERWVRNARRVIRTARNAAEVAASITPNTGGWLALAEAEYGRVRGVAAPNSWSSAAATWDRLERPPLAAYCRWREAEALVAAGASRVAASVPLQTAYGVATSIGAGPLRRELELLAERARLDPMPAPVDAVEAGLESTLGLTPREAEVLSLVARGYTNREIASALVISVKTASVHVSHILRKLDAPNRREAAAIAHRLAAPGSG